MHISLVNIHLDKTQEVSIDISKYNLSHVTGRILASSQIQDHNTFENPIKIKPAVFTAAFIKGNRLIVKLPPFSIVILELK